MKLPISIFILTLVFQPLLASTLGMAKAQNKSIEEKLKEYISRDIQHKGRVEVERVFYRGEIPVDAEVTLVDPSPALGVINFEVSWNEGDRVRQVFGTASAKLYLPIVVAKTALRNNDLFTNENCSLKEKEVSPYRMTGYYDSLESLKNFRVRGYINPGMVISYNQTQSPNLVNSGESVELVRLSPGITVSVRARALESGRQDQWIRVENLSNRKVVQARVIQQGTVSVH